MTRICGWSKFLCLIFIFILLPVLPCAAATRHYYIAAEDVTWDYAPSVRDLLYGCNLKHKSCSAHHETAQQRTAIQGCLSGADGNYVLAQDDSGTMFLKVRSYSHRRALKAVFTMTERVNKSALGMTTSRSS